MAYPTNATSYTSAYEGYPLGDLNWFPARKTDWEGAGMPTTDVEEAVNSLPTEFSLSQNFPNPFNPTTSIVFSLAKTGHVKISIYNMLGQKIQDLVNQKVIAGTHEVAWNGKDQSGKAASSGIYFYRMETDSHIAMKKMTLIK